MHDRAVEQIGDGREPDMRMRAHVEARAGHERCGTDVVEKDERADGSHGERRQHSPHREAADVMLMRLQERVDGRSHGVRRDECWNCRFYWPIHRGAASVGPFPGSTAA